MPATELLFKDDHANGNDRPGVTLVLKVANIKSKAIDNIVDPSTNTSVHDEDINSWALLSIAPKVQERRSLSNLVWQMNWIYYQGFLKIYDISLAESQS